MTPVNPTKPINSIKYINPSRHNNDGKQAHHDVARRDAGHRFCRCLQIAETGGIKLEAPEGIEAGVCYEGQCERYGHDGIVRAEHPLGDSYPKRNYCQQERHDDKIECCRQIQ